MKIADAEQFVRARCEPAVAGVGLALGTVPVATREEGDGTMAASGALIQMAAQRCRAAVLDGPEHSELLPAQMGLISPDEAVARRTDDVGHLQGGRLHLFSSAANAWLAGQYWSPSGCLKDWPRPVGGAGKGEVLTVSSSLACPSSFWGPADRHRLPANESRS